MYTAEQLDKQLGTTAQGKKNDEWRQAISDQAAETIENKKAQSFGLRQIRDQERYDSLDLERRKRDVIEEAIANTPEDTGRLSSAMLKTVNSVRGIETKDNDIQDGQIIEGGWLGDSGDYGFVIARKGADGKITPEPHRFSRADIYGMASNRPDLYDASAVESMGKKLQEADRSYLPAGRLEELTNKYKASRDKLENDLNAARMNISGNGRFGYQTGSGVEIAKINAASRDNRAKISADAVRYRADAMKEIARMRSTYTGNKSNPKYHGSDIKALASILSDPLSGEDEKNAARNMLNHITSLIDGKGADGEEVQDPANVSQETVVPPAVEKPAKVSGAFTQLSPDEYGKLTDEEKADYKKRWIEWKNSQAK